MSCRCRFFLPGTPGNRVAQQLDHYEGLTSLSFVSQFDESSVAVLHYWLLMVEAIIVREQMSRRIDAATYRTRDGRSGLGQTLLTAVGAPASGGV
ncbi:hypothetical protein LAUMK4_05797 [Mycobacterium persicum]|uniref:Uncharacterized protein n=1 Tax=Mycobacterium persicum TaxID=1487726 RepID=A0ABY6RSG1_9MYCO|nr:hypothetical protein LAUMK4_05797 [Mycobacterium persicum]